MSLRICEGPLATYNSLTDKNLSNYFAQTRVRRHILKSGLITKDGSVVSEYQYLLNTASKEHKKYEKDLREQAIVHKCLDLERTRQVILKNKEEQRAKEERVRRVRASRGLRVDEERIRPYSSYSDSNQNEEYVDEDGRPLTAKTTQLKKDVESLNLDSAMLKRIARKLMKFEQGESLVSPYAITRPFSNARNVRASR